MDPEAGRVKREASRLADGGGCEAHGVRADLGAADVVRARCGQRFDERAGFEIAGTGDEQRKARVMGGRAQRLAADVGDRLHEAVALAV